MKKRRLTIFLLAGIVSLGQRLPLRSTKLAGMRQPGKSSTAWATRGKTRPRNVPGQMRPPEQRALVLPSSIQISLPEVEGGTGAFLASTSMFIPSNPVSVYPRTVVFPTGVVRSKADFGKPGNRRHCLPGGSGFHRYAVTVYDPDTEKLGLDPDAHPPLVGFI